MLVQKGISEGVIGFRTSGDLKYQWTLVCNSHYAFFQDFGLISAPQTEGLNQPETPQKGIMPLNHSYTLR